MDWKKLDENVIILEIIKGKFQHVNKIKTQNTFWFEIECFENGMRTHAAKPLLHFSHNCLLSRDRVRTSCENRSLEKTGPQYDSKSLEL